MNSLLRCVRERIISFEGHGKQPNEVVLVGTLREECDNPEEITVSGPSLWDVGESSESSMVVVRLSL